jgi:23S rRNA-/tRNA-specific pseudouridylate synthase
MNNPLEIIYHDYSLAVINKSSGLLVHRNIL